MTEHDLKGRVALVTGSTAGIGRAVAEELGRRGASLVCHGVDAVRRASVMQAWTEQGWPVIACDTDLSRANAGTELVQQVTVGLGPIDILVLNASLELPERLEDLSEAAILKQFAVNMTASLDMLRACLPDMRERGWGRVVAMGSVQEERPNASHLFYNATKAGLTSIMLNLARHDAGPCVTLNVVRPGAILTDRNRQRLGDPAYEKAVLERIPGGRIGKPEDCVGLVSLLCSEAGAYINGAVVAIDGGLRL